MFLSAYRCHVAAVNDLTQPEEPVPNAQLTDASIADIIEALKQTAGPENAAKIKTLLINIQRYQQQSAQPGSVPAQDADSTKADATAPATAAVDTNAAPAAVLAAADASPGSAAAGGGGSTGQQAAQEEQPLVAYLLPIKTKEARKVWCTFSPGH